MKYLLLEDGSGALLVDDEEERGLLLEGAEDQLYGPAVVAPLLGGFVVVVDE